jgi:hypothetical protein
MWVGGWVGGLVGAAGPQSILTCCRNVENHRHGAAKKYNKLNNTHSSKTNYTIHFFEEREREREGGEFGWAANMVGCS